MKNYLKILLLSFTTFVFIGYSLIFLKIPLKPELLYSLQQDKNSGEVTDKFTVNDIFVYKIRDSILSKTKNCLYYEPLKQDGTQQIVGCVYTKTPEIMINDYTKMLMSFLYFNTEPKNILILGLGTAILPRTLNETLGSSKIDIVDISPKLNDLNKQYFSFDIENSKNIKFYLDDGFDFIQKARNNNKKYDIIFVDVFDESYIPKQFMTDEFMENSKKVMTLEGLFIINSFEKSSTRIIEDNLIIKNFGNNYYYLSSGGNKITITNYDNRKVPLPTMEEIKRNADKFTKQFKRFGIDSTRLLKLIKRN